MPVAASPTISASAQRTQHSERYSAPALISQVISSFSTIKQETEEVTKLLTTFRADLETITKPNLPAEQLAPPTSLDKIKSYQQQLYELSNKANGEDLYKLIIECRDLGAEGKEIPISEIERLGKKAIQLLQENLQAREEYQLFAVAYKEAEDQFQKYRETKIAEIKERYRDLLSDDSDHHIHHKLMRRAIEIRGPFSIGLLSKKNKETVAELEAVAKEANRLVNYFPASAYTIPSPPNAEAKTYHLASHGTEVVRQIVELGTKRIENKCYKLLNFDPTDENLPSQLKDANSRSSLVFGRILRTTDHIAEKITNELLPTLLEDVRKNTPEIVAALIGKIRRNPLNDQERKEVIKYVIDYQAGDTKPIDLQSAPNDGIRQIYYHLPPHNWNRTIQRAAAQVIKNCLIAYTGEMGAEIQAVTAPLDKLLKVFSATDNFYTHLSALKSFSNTADIDQELRIFPAAISQAITNQELPQESLEPDLRLRLQRAYQNGRLNALCRSSDTDLSYIQKHPEDINLLSITLLASLAQNKFNILLEDGQETPVLCHFAREAFAIHGREKILAFYTQQPSLVAALDLLSTSNAAISDPKSPEHTSLQKILLNLALENSKELCSAGWEFGYVRLKILEKIQCQLPSEVTQEIISNLSERPTPLFHFLCDRGLSYKSINSLRVSDSTFYDRECCDQLTELIASDRIQVDREPSIAKDQILHKIFITTLRDEEEITERRAKGIAELYNHLNAKDQTKAAQTVYTAEDLKQAITFARATGNLGWDDLEQAIRLSKLPKALELVTELREFINFDDNSLQALPYLLRHREEAKQTFQEMRAAFGDNYIYTPTLAFPDPKAAVWELNFSPRPMKAGFGKEGFPEKYTDALITSLELQFPHDPSPDYSPQTATGRQNRVFFNQALNQCYDLASEFPPGEFARKSTKIQRLVYQNPENALLFVRGYPEVAKLLSECNDAISNSKDYQNLALKADFDGEFNLASYGPKVLEDIQLSKYPKPFIVFILGQLNNSYLSGDSLINLCKLIPPSSELCRDKFGIEYIFTAIQSAPVKQNLFLAFVAEKVTTLNRTDSQKLATAMRLIAALPDCDLVEDLYQKGETQSTFSLDQILETITEKAIERLKEHYPAHLIELASPDFLQEFLSKNAEFAQTLKRFRAETKIPIVQAIVINDLVHRFYPEYHARTQLEQTGEAAIAPINFYEHVEFCIQQSTLPAPTKEAALAYIKALQEDPDLKSLFSDLPPEKLTLKKRIFKESEISHTHIIADLTAEDRMRDIVRAADVYFDQHLSTVFKDLESICQPEISRDLGNRGAALSAYLKLPNETNLLRVYESFPRIREIPEDARYDFCQKEFDKVKEQQAQAKTFADLRKLRQTISSTAEKHLKATSALRESMGQEPIGSFIESLGFNVHQSFVQNIYLGEIEALKKSLNSEFGARAKERNPKAAEELTVVIDTLDQVTKAINSDLNHVAKQAEKSLESLRQQLELLKELSDLKNDSPSTAAESVAKLEEKSPELYHRLNKYLDLQPSEEQGSDRNTQLISLFQGYYAALQVHQDLENLISTIHSDSEVRILTYSLENNFYGQLEATKGQCLDYRSSVNSIGNSIHLPSLQDNTRSLVIAKDGQGILRFDAITSLNSFTIDGQTQTGLLADIAYTPDGSAMNWSKMEGYLDFLYKVSRELNIPMIIPDASIQNYKQQLEDFCRDRDLELKESKASVQISVGPTGSTYLEIRGFTGYTADTAVESNIFII